MTPTGADSSNRTYQNDRHDKTKPRLTTCGQAEKWATPSAQEFGGTAEQHLERKRKAIAKGAKMGLVVTQLNAQTEQFAIPKSESSTGCSPSIPPGETMMMGGVELLNYIRNSHPSSPWRLNPLFGHWLMRLPLGWIGCALSETELTLWSSRWRSRLSGTAFTAPTE